MRHRACRRRRVPFDKQAVPGPERHQVLVPAAIAVHAARKCALEAIRTQGQVVAEAPVDEVAAPAVVEPVVGNEDVSRAVLDMQAVREQRRAVATVTELASPDDDVARFDDLQGRPEPRSLRGYE